jgi:hypothetical protein
MSSGIGRICSMVVSVGLLRTWTAGGARLGAWSGRWGGEAEQGEHRHPEQGDGGAADQYWSSCRPNGVATAGDAPGPAGTDKGKRQREGQAEHRRREN